MNADSEMTDALTQQEYDDLRALARLTDDEGNVDNGNLDSALYKRLRNMRDEFVMFYDSSPNLTVKGYRMMLEYLEAQQTASPQSESGER